MGEYGYLYESAEEESNNRAFESLISDLESRYSGMYIVIADGGMISAHNSLDETLKIGDGAHKHRIVFKVGEKPFERVRLGWRASIRPVGRR